MTRHKQVKNTLRHTYALCTAKAAVVNHLANARFAEWIMWKMQIIKNLKLTPHPTIFNQKKIPARFVGNPKIKS